MTGTLPGEKKVETHAASSAQVGSHWYASSGRCSSVSVVKWALARILGMFQARSFKGGVRSNVTPEILRDAGRMLIVDAQRGWTAKAVCNRFRGLCPVMKDKCWVVGTPVSDESPFTPENEPQVLLQYDHPLTELIMRNEHRDGGHRGRDATGSL